jgi:hypothetical protein
MRKTVVLLASVFLVVLLATGMALAQKSTAADTKHPRVVDVRPKEGARGVSHYPRVVAFFSEDMRERSLFRAMRVFKKGSNTPISDYTFWYNARDQKAILEPEIALKRGVTYKAVVGTRAEDLAGNRLDQNRSRDGLQPKVWYFKIEN